VIQGRKILGDNIRAQRKKKKLTIVQLAHKLKPDGDAYSHLSRIERGEIACTIDTIWAIAVALEVQPSTLLE